MKSNGPAVAPCNFNNDGVSHPGVSWAVLVTPLQGEHGGFGEVLKTLTRLGWADDGN